jgi:hypothetical protein
VTEAGTGAGGAGRALASGFRARLTPAAGPLVILALVLLANLPALAGLVDVSPLGPIGITSLAVHKSVLPGQWFTDPNIGWTAQALGHLAAEDWLHGIVPWWNPYEGLGAPLAAGMQSAAFFPPTLLLALANGQLLFHVTLEAGAGLATWFLLRELGFGRPVATLGGVLFALDGTLAWFGNAPANPVALLPVLILGVERLARRPGVDRAGILLVAAGLALSIYAGFPETAYLDGLLAAAWFLFRLCGTPASGRLGYAGRVGLGSAIGGLVSAPLLLAFAAYVPSADVGLHAGSLATAHQPLASLAMLGLPYLYGPIAAFVGSDPTHELGNFWGGSGGFLTAPVLVLAGAGLLAGRREKGLRIFLGVAASLLLAWIFGLQPFQWVLSHVVPGASDVMVFRYAMPAIELAVVLLACCGAESLARGGARGRRGALAGGAATLALLLFDVFAARHTLETLWRDSSYRPYLVGMICWAGVTATAVVLAGVLGGRSDPDGAKTPSRRRLGPAVVLAVVAVDAVVMFAFPQFSAPRSVTVDSGPAQFLEAHLGSGRFFSMWVYHADYGSYFGLASLDSDDLPVPDQWADYVRANLAPDADPTIFDGRRVEKGGPSAAEDLRRHLAAYEQAGVRYVLSQTGTQPFGPERDLVDGVSLVYRDPLVTIYQLPAPQPIFRTTGGTCSLHAQGTGAVTASCSGPATLVRAELAFPGWSATVNGRPVEVGSAGGLQAVALAGGSSSVSFDYTPAHLGLGEGLAGAGFIGAAAVVGGPGLLRRRRNASTGAPARSCRRRSP